MIIGKKNKELGMGWCAGLEFKWRGNEMKISVEPKVEVWCYKLVSFPPEGEMIDKKRNIKGFWKIFLLDLGNTQMRRILVSRKGFRPKYVSVPVKIRMQIKSW